MAAGVGQLGGHIERAAAAAEIIAAVGRHDASAVGDRSHGPQGKVGVVGRSGEVAACSVPLTVSAIAPPEAVWILPVPSQPLTVLTVPELATSAPPLRRIWSQTWGTEAEPEN